MAGMTSPEVSQARQQSQVTLSEVRNRYERAYHEASVYSPENGQVSGFSKQEYNELVEYLQGKTKIKGEVGEYARQQLAKLNYMKNCAFNKTDLKNNKPGFFESIFSKEKYLNRQNVISYDTMLLNNGGNLE